MSSISYGGVGETSKTRSKPSIFNKNNFINPRLKKTNDLDCAGEGVMLKLQAGAVKLTYHVTSRLN